MEPAPETTPPKKSVKLTFRSVFLGIIAGLVAETLFILLAFLMGKYENDAVYLWRSPMWWLATGILSFFLGRYVTSKISGVQLKSLFKWEEEKD